MIDGGDYDNELIEDFDAGCLGRRKGLAVEDIDEHESRPEVVQEQVVELEGFRG